MLLKSYSLSKVEKMKLQKGIAAALSIPFIDSIEDFIWEGIFGYMKNVDLVDPFNNIRSKSLFDVVDKSNKIGWSAKALQCRISPNCEFEIVIQRADIFRKQADLGFKNLSKDSDPNLLGKALIKHWQSKILKDAKAQDVKDQRVCILLKWKNQKFAYLEEALMEYVETDLYWKWSNETKTGLQGIRKVDDFVVYRWYPNQTQFFERFKLGDTAYVFDLNSKRFAMDEIIDILAHHINT